MQCSAQEIAATLFLLKYIPEDIDTTSVGLSVLYKFGKVTMDTINRVHNKMLLKHVSVAVTNTLFLFHFAGRGHEVLMGEVFAKTY